MRLRALIFPACALAACSSAATNNLEGDFSGECTNGADEDRDLLFDCMDPDCTASPSCVAGADTDDLGVDTDDDDDDTDTIDDTDVGDTDVVDTDVVESQDPTWNSAAWANGWPDFIDCNGGTVTLRAETRHWGGNVMLYMTQTDSYGAYIAWEEVHTLDETSASAGNGPLGFSVFERTLATGARVDQQAPDVSTLWGCGTVQPTLNPTAANFEVAFAIAVWAPGQSTGQGPMDCVYFGHNADELIHDRYTGGTGSQGSGRNPPTWASSVSCTRIP